VAISDLWVVPTSLAVLLVSFLFILSARILVSRVCDSADGVRVTRLSTFMLSHPYILATTVFLMPLTGCLIAWASYSWVASALGVTPYVGFISSGFAILCLWGGYNVVTLHRARHRLMA
jgi:hypothetical protein